MSNWTGGKYTIDPDSPTSTTCTWQFCGVKVPHRFYRERIYLCRDHTLLVWAIVNEQMNSSNPPTPTPKEEEPEAVVAGDVYYIRTAGRIKIGHSVNAARRLASYPPDMEVLYIRAGDRKLENAEHRRFKPYLTDGREWFEDREEVRDMINQLIEADPDWRKRWKWDLEDVARKRVVSDLTVRRIGA